MPDFQTDERSSPASPGESAAGRSDPARARFYFIAAHRLFGAVLVILGMLAMQGALDWSKDIGKVLAIVGVIEFFVIPLVLARMWRTIPK